MLTSFTPNRRAYLNIRFSSLIWLLPLCGLLCYSTTLLIAQSALSPPATVLSEDAGASERFLAVHGRRSIMMGYSNRGLEIWGYPFQILSDYRIGFRQLGATTETDGQVLLRRVDYRSDSITRTYIGPDFLVRETIFVPLDQPGAVITYQVEGTRQVDVVTHFQPVMDLMWPGSVGGRYTRWNVDIPGYLITEPEHGFSAAIGSPDIISHDDTVNSAIVQQTSFSFVLRPQVRNKQPASASVYIMLNDANSATPAAALHDLAAHADERVAQAAKHYADLSSHALRVLTPDPEVNDAIAWSEIALDQAWVCNPLLGCGIVAGYGASRDALRPQYAWFFAGDGLVATNALIAEGEYSRAKEELTFIQKYQQPKTGMIWHELSQSAGYVDWAKYPYMYVHVDITADYLAALARYVEASGDITFATQHWPSILQAYQYCRSLTNPTDHLPHIPPDKEGGDEQARPGDDLSLSAGVLAADSGFATLAKLAGHPELQAEALSEAALLRSAIAARYWDAASNFWIDGHTQAGAPIPSRRRGPIPLISEGIFTPEQSDSLLSQLASADFRTDWGPREVALSAPDFDPYSYGRGSVTAPGTAQSAIGFWRAHRSETGLSIWRDLVAWNRLDAPGHMHELTAGNFFHEQTESVPEQTWSSASFLDSTVQGLLGLHIEGTGNRIDFIPHLPPEWDRITLENVRLPNSVLTFAFSQNSTSMDLDIDNQGAPTQLLFAPRIPLGARLIRAEYQGRKAPATVQLFAENEDQHANLSLQVPSGKSHCHLQFGGGLSILEQRPTLQVGDPSTRLKITSLTLHGHTLSIEADVHSESTASFLIRTPWKLTNSQGATSRTLPNGDYEVHIASPSGSDNTGFTHARSTLTFAGR